MVYDQVYGYNALSQQLERATEVKPNQAYYVNVSASPFTPPLPRDVSTTFVYDGDGGRVKKITAAGTTTYLGDAYEIAPSGTTTKYVYAGSLRLAAKESTGALRYYHGDHLGSSNVITDGTGAVVEVAEYTPYGSLASRSGTVTVPHQFTGQRLDESTGLYFYNARYYDPTLGRFISPDSIVQAPADPQTLNRYSYVRNNPVRYVDPTGHSWFSKLWNWLKDYRKDQWEQKWSKPEWWLWRAIQPESPIAPGTTQQFNQAVNATATFLVNQWGFSPAAANATIGAVLAIPTGGNSLVAAGLAYGTTELLGTGEARQLIGSLAGFFEQFGVSPEASRALASQVVSAGVTVAVAVASTSARTLYNKVVHYDVTWAKGGAAVDKIPGAPPVADVLQFL